MSHPARPLSTEHWLLEQRYREEPIFHQLVDGLHASMRKLPIAVDDLEQILALAFLHYRNDLDAQRRAAASACPGGPDGIR